MFKEKFKGEGFLKCRNDRHFVNISNICDGIYDCFEGSDEFYCLNEKYEKDKCKLENRNELICENLDENFLKNLNVNFKKLKIKNLIENENEKEEEEKKKRKREKNIKNKITFLSVENSRIYDLKYFDYFPNLVFLIFKNNSIEKIEEIFSRKKLILLNLLDLSKNSIFNLKFLKNFVNENLIYLDISFTKIQFILHKHIHFLNKLQIFIINFCQIQIIQIYSLIHLNQLHFNSTQIFHLNHLIQIPNHLNYLQKFYSSSFTLCCIFKKHYPQNFTCQPSYSLIYSCQKMIKSSGLSIYFLILGFFGLLGNFFLIFLSFRLISNEKSLKILILFSDILLFAYLASISVKDKLYDENYIFKHDIEWRSSFFCYFLKITFHSSIVLSQFFFNFLVLKKFLSQNYLNKNLSKIIKIFYFISLIIYLILFVNERIFGEKFQKTQFCILLDETGKNYYFRLTLRITNLIFSILTLFFLIKSLKMRKKILHFLFIYTAIAIKNFLFSSLNVVLRKTKKKNIFSFYLIISLLFFVVDFMYHSKSNSVTYSILILFHLFTYPSLIFLHSFVIGREHLKILHGKRFFFFFLAY